MNEVKGFSHHQKGWLWWWHTKS